MVRIATLALVASLLVAGCIAPASGGPASSGTPEATAGTPDATTKTNCTTTTPDAAPPAENVTTDYEVQRRLQREFAPGTCIGMPTVVTRSRMNETLAANAALVEKLRRDYGTNDTETLYELVEQFRAIRVEERANGTYAFTVIDGRCCVVETIRGRYDPATDMVTVTNRTTESMPC